MYDENVLLNALAVVIKKHGNYTDRNVTISDNRVLDDGVATAAVIDDGTVESPRDDQYNYMVGVTARYNAVVHVYRKYVEDKQSRSDLRSDTQNLREIVDGYHRLNGNVESCKVVAIGAPIYIGDAQGNGPFFIARRLTVSIIHVEPMVLLE